MKEYHIFKNSELGVEALLKGIFLRESDKNDSMIIVSEDQLHRLQDLVPDREARPNRFPLNPWAWSKPNRNRIHEVVEDRPLTTLDYDEPWYTKYNVKNYDWGVKRDFKHWWGSDVRVTMDRLAFSKLAYYTTLVESEISGFGKIVKEGKSIRIVDLKIFKQSCSSGGTKLDDEAMQKFLFELIKGGEDPSQWNLWWHTHYNFEAYWSCIDESNITRHSKNHYLVSICINQELRNVVRIDHKNKCTKLPPLRNIFFVDDKIRAECLLEVNRLVSGWNFNWFKKKKKGRGKNREIRQAVGTYRYGHLV